MLPPPAGTNACVDQPCSLLCLPQPGQRHACVCPDGTPITTLPSGELQCQCPHGYQRHNNTCVKLGESSGKGCVAFTHSRYRTLVSLRELQDALRKLSTPVNYTYVGYNNKDIVIPLMLCYVYAMHLNIVRVSHSKCTVIKSCCFP